MTRLFAVVGKPVLHSLSPQIHNAAFAELGMDGRYVRLASESAEDALRIAREAGIMGMNVTAPFKEEMFNAVDALDENAEALGAVNTIMIEDGVVYGHNTDPKGVLGALKGNGIDAYGKKAVVLGAGGAARAAALALGAECSEVLIVNRTFEKARKAAESLGCKWLPIEELGNAVDGAGIVVSAVSTSEEIIPPELLKKEMAVLDANYSATTRLASDAAAKGCSVISGKEWLIYQGASAFEIFTGEKAPIEAMRRAMGAKELPRNNIALVGFMGCGKNTVSQKLNEKSGMRIIDTDSCIEQRAGKSIREIFMDGEEQFRKLESNEAALIPDAKNSIINCGGGLVLRNRKELLGSVVVWLWAREDILKKRIPKDGSRPLLDCDTPEKRISELLSERLGSYAEASDIMIDSSKDPQEVAERILYEVHKTFPHIRKD